MDFDAWWKREGERIDPDTSDVPWFDKRRALAEAAWEAAKGVSSNYVADHELYPQKITFANGRVVKMKGTGHLFVTREQPDAAHGEERK